MSNERTDRPRDTIVLQHRNPVGRDYVIVSRVVLIGYSQVSDGAKVTYWVIYSHDWYEPRRGGRKGYAYPTIGRLAQLRHTTERTIQRHLNELIGVGLLTRLIRKGKPSILYIEEPSEAESEQIHHEQEDKGDISVGGAVTKSSPQQEDEKKQEKAVNGVEELVMEKRSPKESGWKPICAILRPKLVPSTNSRLTWLTEQILAQTGDDHSAGCYRLIAKRCSQDLLFEALSLLAEAKRAGSIRHKRGALFLGIVRRLCRERGLPDPLRGSRDIQLVTEAANDNVGDSCWAGKKVGHRLGSTAPTTIGESDTSPPRSQKWFNQPRTI